MRPDLALLTIDQLIVHDVPARRVSSTQSDLVLTDRESDLDADLRNYFSEKIRGSLQRAAADVQFDPESASPICRIVTELLENVGAAFVGASREVAEHLYGSQTGVNSPGLLVVSRAAVPGVKAVAVMKVERESGVRAQSETLDGQVIFTMEHLRSLMLTVHTRVFKVGLFWLSDRGDEVQGLVCDRQQGSQSSREVANFFLRRFLGCQLRVAPEAATRQFFLAAQTFISAAVSSPEQRARYEFALLTEMNSNNGEINPRRFVEAHLQGGDRKAFEDALTNAGMSLASFVKDTSLVASSIKRVHMDFEGGVRILAPPDAMGREVQMSSLDDGRTRLQIEDKLTAARSGR